MQQMKQWRAVPVLGLLAFVSVILFSLTARPARAASLIVSTAADTVADDGECSLREAIIAANTDTASGTTTGECVAGSGTDDIDLTSAPSPITLGSQLPAVTSEIDITGDGAANTIIQASACNPITLPGGCTPAGYGIFEVSATGDLTLEDRKSVV